MGEMNHADIERPPRAGFTVRCSPAYKSWVSRIVKTHTEGTISHLVTRALAEYAKRHGFEKPPSRT